MGSDLTLYHVDLRVHWCRTKANAERWAEEKELVAEEMRRTLRFFDYQIHQWQTRAAVGKNINSGSAAYARKSVSFYCRSR